MKNSISIQLTTARQVHVLQSIYKKTMFLVSKAIVICLIISLRGYIASATCPYWLASDVIPSGNGCNNGSIFITTLDLSTNETYLRIDGGPYTLDIHDFYTFGSLAPGNHTVDMLVSIGGTNGIIVCTESRTLFVASICFTNPDNSYYLDSDGDGYGAGASYCYMCPPPGYVHNNADCNDLDASLNQADLDGDGYTTCFGDCNDANAAIHPNAQEACNGYDDDCNNSIDEGVLTTFYADADGDGFGNAGNTIAACSPPSGFVSNNTDCNDGNNAINPSSAESCNGIDDNCNNSIDDGLTFIIYYEDADADGLIDPGNTMNACLQPAGYVADTSATDACPSANQATVAHFDSVTCGCSPGYYPVAQVIGSQTVITSCNLPAGAINFNGNYSTISFGNSPLLEMDSQITVEAWVKPSGESHYIIGKGLDYPALYGWHLFQVGNQFAFGIGSGFSTWDLLKVVSSVACNDSQWYHVAGTYNKYSGVLRIYVNGIVTEEVNYYDGILNSGEPIVIGMTIHSIFGTPYVGDLDEVRIWNTERSGCELDHFRNCELTGLEDGLVAYYNFNQGISFGNNQDVTILNDATPNGLHGSLGGFSLSGSTSNWVEPGAVNGSCALLPWITTWYRDDDGDGFGDIYNSIAKCIQTTGYVSDSTDCNDASATIYPNASEVCNGTDDNCNGAIDEGFALTTFYADADSDGYGNSTNSVQACSLPSGYVSGNTDCNDANGSIKPGATEICNGIDDNCNGTIDENTATISPSGTVSSCKNTNVTFAANSGAGFAYQWFKNGASISGATNQTYTTSNKADYKVTVTNPATSCSSTSAITKLVAGSSPNATITPLGDLDICQAGSVVLQANSGAGLTYRWKKGNSYLNPSVTTQSYTATTTGTYKVEVSSGYGCTKLSTGAKVTNSCKLGDEEDNAIQELASELKIYPNPTNGKFLIELSLPGEATDVTVEVISMLGQTVFSERVEVTNGMLQKEIQLNHFVPGIYFVRVTAGDQIISKKIEVIQ